jgi:hypothetical protein
LADFENEKQSGKLADSTEDALARFEGGSSSSKPPMKCQDQAIYFFHFREGDGMQSPHKIFQTVTETDGGFCKEGIKK